MAAANHASRLQKGTICINAHGPHASSSGRPFRPYTGWRHSGGSIYRFRSKRLNSTCKAELQTSDPEVFNGMFGDWSIDDNDRTEVFRYRLGLTVAAAGVVLSTVLGLMSPPEGLIGGRLADVASFVGAGGFGMSLYYIHVYVTPLKRFVQGCWAVGVASGLILAAKEDTTVLQYVMQHPTTVWAVGPLFAAVTGVAVKEGLCYGKPEAALLALVTPTLLLGHLSGLLPEGGQKVLAGGFAVIFAIFAARKYTQAIKDDIGDKSVFEFQKLPPEEQEAKMAVLRQERR